MANVLTGTGTGPGPNLVQTAYDRAVEFALRPMPQFRQIADKRPVQQAMPGSSVVFNLYADLATATGTLTETVDPDSVAIPATTNVTVTLAEYGNAALVTRKLRLFTLSDVDPGIADIIAYNLADSVDIVVRTVLIGGSNVIRENAGAMLINGGTTGAVAATDTLKSRDIRAAVTKLRGAAVLPRLGSNYVAYIHPDQSYDLRGETGTNAADGWRPAHVYNDTSTENLWGGFVGEYEGAAFIESPRIYFTGDGAGTTPNKVQPHRALVMGRQALAEAVAEEFHVILGPVVDKLMRFRPIGWYGVAGWSLYRSAALYRIETSSSVTPTV